ncbi:MAG: hypothetical protein E6I80_03285 [Chloroflexi bacterium]|nr:MAG: hypothetical protein E6I80_03285 [Chloroflexota bacterium]HXL37412.1 hypothetical protein [Ktedonobacteraceae bacterium]
MQEEQQVNQGFNPSDHLMKIKSRQGLSDYLPVQWRLVWFRQECPHGTIETEELEYDTEKECSLEAFVWNSEKRRSEKVVKTAKGYARYRAVVTDGKGGRATGTKAECRANFEDYGEKAETGAIGRALAGLGFGTQFAPELDEEHRIVDSPVERGTSPVEGSDTGNGRKMLATVRPAATKSSSVSHDSGQSAATTAAEAAKDAGATEQQLSSIRKLCEHLGKPEPEHAESMSFASAKELIGQLSQEYRQSRSKAS